MNKNFKILFYNLLFLSTLISISATSWMGMWIGLEMNLLAIIPLMYSNLTITSSEASVKYFIVQTIASSIIIINITLVMMNFNMSSNMNLINLSLIMMNSAFLIKIGMAPFHFWFPEIIHGLNWINSMIILTWQKIAPMILFMFNMTNNSFTIFIIITSAIISSVSSLNMINLKKILAFSSINHMSWMMSMMVFSKMIWIMYFIIYTLSTMILILFMNKFKILFVNQISLLNNKKEMIMFFMLGFISFMGLPPTIGFISKWLTIQVLIWENWLFLSIILILLTTLMIFIYFQMMISSILFNSKKNNFFFFNKMLFSNLTIINLFNILGMVLITLMFNF
uniref:NADH dehydrogenase subunit 2 n=1 Tax=Rhagonycha nigroimpressa TaxID=3027144 RepID=UPI0023D83EC9|nr:NADH dehydrogenase subunit 2 [Rhagonycha nigroimpressa]WCS40134.1 NADH dehydrogenase subunit 2 [Rhagonycha nigroimpressa]WRO44845.1 NADH dehydrogenase subunit 2 [Rhagonycha nigroimpressa]